MLLCVLVVPENKVNCIARKCREQAIVKTVIGKPCLDNLESLTDLCLHEKEILENSNILTIYNNKFYLINRLKIKINN